MSFLELSADVFFIFQFMKKVALSICIRYDIINTAMVATGNAYMQKTHFLLHMQEVKIQNLSGTKSQKRSKPHSPRPLGHNCDHLEGVCDQNTVRL